ncbi:MAG: thioredoxin domain-containing protein [archaeon]
MESAKQHTHHHEQAKNPAEQVVTAKNKWVYVSVALLAILLVSVVSNFFMISKLTNYVGPPKVTGVGGPGFIGKADAPLTLTMYTDFQCPYCASFFTGAFPGIKENFIDTGLLKFEVKSFPLSFHSNAKIAANAAKCAEAQGSFLDYEAELYANQGALDRASLIKYARGLSLDEAKFTECLDSSAYQDEIDAEASEGASSGISGTPGFLLNGESLPLGASPYSEFASALSTALGN